MFSRLWEIALGGTKSERSPAQECLDKIPNKEQKIVAALGKPATGNAAHRRAVARRVGLQEAVPALQKALAKEKNEIVKDELIKTLESLGVPLDELLDIDKLDQEAEKGLKKGIPKDLDWFPFAQLPSVPWADSGKPVPTTIIHWFILQGYKLKNAEANPALRRYCSLFHKEDREQLGKFVLEAWIAQDTKPKYTAGPGRRRSTKDAHNKQPRIAKQYPQYYPDFDEQRVYQTQFNCVLDPTGRLAKQHERNTRRRRRLLWR